MCCRGKLFQRFVSKDRDTFTPTNFHNVTLRYLSLRSHRVHTLTSITQPLTQRKEAWMMQRTPAATLLLQWVRKNVVRWTFGYLSKKSLCSGSDKQWARGNVEHTTFGVLQRKCLLRLTSPWYLSLWYAVKRNLRTANSDSTSLHEIMQHTLGQQRCCMI